MNERIFWIKVSEECSDDEISQIAAKLQGSELTIGNFRLGTVDTVSIDLQYKTIGVTIQWVDGIEVGSIIRGR